MPRKVKEQEEEEVQIGEPVKKKTFVVRWFEEHCPNNAKDIRAICELTARSAEEQFGMCVRSSNHEVFAMVFFATFQSILDFLRDHQKRYSQYTIEIGGSVNIGYCNSQSEDNEKVGNFMPIMEYIGINRTIVDPTTIGIDTTTKNFIRWKELNVKKNVEHYKQIQELAYNRILTDYRTDLRTSEATIPLFCIFMDHINSVLRMKYLEAEGTTVDEISLNVLGLFDAYYSYDETDGKECYEYTPSVFFKLSLKNDTVSSSHVV